MTETAETPQPNGVPIADLAHVVRNALTPSAHFLESLLVEAAAGQRCRVEAALEGVNRVLAFVDEHVRIAQDRGPGRPVEWPVNLAEYATIAREGCYQVVGDVVIVSVREMAALVRGAQHPDDKWTAVLDASPAEAK